MFCRAVPIRSILQRMESDPNIDVTVSPGFHMFYLVFNMREEPLSDISVRRAIAHVIDREEIIFSLFQGYMLPLAEFVPQSSPFFNPDVEVAEYDPELAARLSGRRRLRHGSQRRPHQPPHGSGAAAAWSC